MLRTPLFTIAHAGRKAYSYFHEEPTGAPGGCRARTGFLGGGGLEADIRLLPLRRIQPATTRLAAKTTVSKSPRTFPPTVERRADSSPGRLAIQPRRLHCLRIPDLTNRCSSFPAGCPVGPGREQQFLNDFFEVDLPVIATSSGVYNDGVFGNSPLAATDTNRREKAALPPSVTQAGLAFNAAFSCFN